MRPRLLGFGIAVVVVTSAIAACSGGDRPNAANVNTEGGVVDRKPPGDSGSDDAQADADAAPRTCNNTIRDGNETDVDCGGNECAPCLDGQACVAPTDCAGGSCVGNVCVTSACNDVVTNGSETDVDCGGDVCAKCTIGKRCKAPSDCVSGACTNESCACPPGMTAVPKAAGGAYCIDGAEVTKGQYNKFLTASFPLSDQSGICKTANTSFVPRDAWPPATTPPAQNGLAFNLSLPVHYVDWCDAHAYCKWANKQLCGKINGGPVAPASANDATESAWYNACSAQGQREWPYGNDFQAGKCNGMGDGEPGSGGYGFSTNGDEGIYTVVLSDQAGNFTAYTHVGCQGGVVGAYQMSGNVAEWEDSCDGAEADASCRLRGGSYAAEDDPTSLSCLAARTEQRVPPAGQAAALADVGFRCCLY
jgi:formylglycine-generating enzyme required for sulfatase activity